jgi:hypothetical protein
MKAPRVVVVTSAGGEAVVIPVDAADHHMVDDAAQRVEDAPVRRCAT